MKFTQKIERFVLDSIKKPHSFIGRQMRKFHLIGKGFIEDKCLLRSSALAYTTLLTIVPIFSAVLLIIKAFGSGSEQQIIIERVQEFIERIIPPGTILKGQETLAHMIATKYYEFAEKMSASRVGSIGIIFLLITIISLLITVEKSMNDIWGVKKNRPIVNKLVIYWAILTLTPVLLIPALSTGFIARSQSIIALLTEYVPFEWFAGLIQSSLLPFVFMILAYTIFYIVMPNTKVRFKSAFFAAVIASFFFNAAVNTFGYIMVLTGKAESFRIVYGTLALVPLLLLFVYIAWVITLFGAEYAFADQNAATYYLEHETANANIISKERLALRLVGEITKAFKEGKESPSAVFLQDKLNLPIRVINNTLNILEKSGILICINERDMIYHPAKSIDTIKIKDVLSSVRSYGKDLELPPNHIGQNIDEVFGKVLKTAAEAGDQPVENLII